jgi:hypothetical protein
VRVGQNEITFNQKSAAQTSAGGFHFPRRFPVRTLLKIYDAKNGLLNHIRRSLRRRYCGSPEADKDKI